MIITRTLIALCLVAAAAAPALAAEPLDTTALDAELDKYWNPDRELVPVEKELFGREGGHELTVYFGVTPNDDFFSYVPLGGRWNFFFADSLGLEVAGAYLISFDADLKDFLEDNLLYGILEKYPQQLLWHADASLTWAPVRGKAAVLTTKLMHFDFQISLGAGAIGTSIEQRDAPAESPVDFAGVFGLGLRAYIDELIAIRADYRQFVFGGDDGVRGPAEFTLGVAFWLGR